jgi:thioredoxin-like negative regulator of GroEL
MAGAAVIAGSTWRRAATTWKVKLGEAALARGDGETALEYLLAAEVLNPRDARIEFLLARTYRRLGKSADIAAKLQAARDCGYSPERLEREWILVKAQAGLMSEAEPHFSRLLTNPGDDGQEICSAFASGYVQNYQFEKARRVLAAWIADYPDDPEPRVAVGRVALHVHDMPQAETHLRKALLLCPEYEGAATLLGRALAEQHKFEEALALIEQRRPRKRDDEMDLVRAECLLNLGRGGESEKLYEAVAARSPENCAALLGLGQARVLSGRADAALEPLNRAFELCPRNLDVRYARAQALSLQGDRTQSESEFREISAARTALTRAGELAAGLARKPDDVGARFELGTTLLKFGDQREGVAWLLSILESEPDHQPTHRMLAEYYAAQGMDEQAARHRRAVAASESQH